jgi:hypothetical protein
MSAPKAPSRIWGFAGSAAVLERYPKELAA